MSPQLINLSPFGFVSFCLSPFLSNTFDGYFVTCTWASVTTLVFGNGDCGERNGDNDVADMMARMLVAMIILSMTTTLQSTEKNALWPSSRHVRSLDSQ